MGQGEERLLQIDTVETIVIQGGGIGGSAVGGEESEILLKASEPRGAQLQKGVKSYCCDEGRNRQRRDECPTGSNEEPREDEESDSRFQTDGESDAESREQIRIAGFGKQAVKSQEKEAGGEAGDV